MTDSTVEDEPLHDAHIVQWHDNCASGTDEFFEHRRDYKRAIERSTVFEDYEFTIEAVDRIAFAGPLYWLFYAGCTRPAHGPMPAN